MRIIGPLGSHLTESKWLAKWGCDPHARLVLGHHLTGKGPSSSLEVYARDSQAYPLRLLEAMLCDIRQSRFLPDSSRSGMIAASHHCEETEQGSQHVAASPCVLQDSAVSEEGSECAPEAPANISHELFEEP